jgi:hypothetical protein
MPDLPDAVWVCAVAADEDPAVVGEHDHQVFGVTWSTSRGSSTRPSSPLRSARFPAFGYAWSRSTARPHDDVYTVIVNPRGRPAGRAWGAECAGAVGRTDGRDAGCPCHQPRPGREELMALGAFATLTAELVRTGVELISRDLEMAQLRQAVTSRIWIEQAKGVLAASKEVTPDEGFQQHRARASSRKLADLVGEVLVQEARRERVAALAMDDARVRVAEARAQAAEQALQAGPNRADPTYRGPGPSPRRPDRTGASRRPGRLARGWRW